MLSGGGVLALVGFVLLFIPGPGLLLLAGGGAMAATQSLMVARIFDRGELFIRTLIQRVRKSGRGRQR